jgi:nitrite reductase/ring-hydroxylating ferredoxin subunit
MALRRYMCEVTDVVVDELRSFNVEGVTWPLIATRIDDEIVVCQGVCPHEDVSLADGTLRDGKVICPGHAYEFDMRSGQCGHRSHLHLRRHRVTVVGSQVWVDLL